jgi:hypothetical protein
MPEMGKEADVNCRNACTACVSHRQRDVTTLSMNVYAKDLREMCET